MNGPHRHKCRRRSGPFGLRCENAMKHRADDSSGRPTTHAAPAVSVLLQRAAYPRAVCHEPIRDFYQTSDRHQSADGRHRILWRRRLPGAAGQRSTDGGLSDDSGTGRFTGRRSRHDGVGGREPARTTVHDDCRRRLDDFVQHDRQHATSRCSSLSTATSTAPPSTCRRRSPRRCRCCRRACRRRRRSENSILPISR